MKAIQIVFAILIGTFVSVSHAGIFKLNVENGVLMGADNVNVNGSFYDVKFEDGSCIELFNKCDDASDFVFNTANDARAASEALLWQVFIDGISGMFDSTPTLTNGCTNGLVCATATTFASDAFSVAVAMAFNNVDENRDALNSNQFRLAENTGVYTDVNYAVWSDASEAVEASAPGAAMILLMGIAGLLVSQRRKQA